MYVCKVWLFKYLVFLGSPTIIFERNAKLVWCFPMVITVLNPSSGPSDDILEINIESNIKQ